MSLIEVKKIIREYAKLLRKNRVAFEQIYLFGSYAMGNAKFYSDIDLAVVKKQRPRNFLAKEGQLWRLAPKVDSRIEPILMGKEDLDKDDGTMMGYEVKKHGILVVSA